MTGIIRSPPTWTLEICLGAAFFLRDVWKYPHIRLDILPTSQRTKTTFVLAAFCWALKKWTSPHLCVHGTERVIAVSGERSLLEACKSRRQNKGGCSPTKTTEYPSGGTRSLYLTRTRLHRNDVGRKICSRAQTWLSDDDVLSSTLVRFRLPAFISCGVSSRPLVQDTTDMQSEMNGD